jgi:hypothetical protein
MDRTAYFNDLMARIEELFYHEMSDCACWKTEFVGVDFIQALDIQGCTPQEIIENCIREITAAGLTKEISYSIGGMDILLYVKVQDCIHMAKEIKLKESGIKIYNCPIINMILDQIIEKLNYETTYVADIEVDETQKECVLKCAIFENPEKIGNVCDWTDECRLIDEDDKWKTVKC